jgi:hypothetical protein
MTPSTGMASGIALPSTLIPVNTIHMVSVPEGYDYCYSRLHQRGLLTFYYTGFRQRSLCARSRSLGLREGSGLLDSERFFSCCYAGFISFPGQISRFPAQYTWGGQPSTTTQFQVLLGKGFHLQARPDHSHGRSAKYAGDVYKPGFGGRHFLSLSRYWFFGTSSRARVSTILVVCCVICDTGSSTVGAGLRLLSAGSPTVSQSSPSP